MAPETEKVDVVFVNHHHEIVDGERKDVLPGAKRTVEVGEARRLVKANVAAYATKTAAKTAGDPDGPTPPKS